jgi:hypothetical protein
MAEKEFIGTIRKCPGCGHELESMTARCPDCGLELSDTGVNQIIANFADKVMEIERRRNRLKTFFVEKKSFLKKELVPYESEWEPNDNELKEFIEHFTIPNSRAEFLEFFIFAMVHIDPQPQTNYQKKWNDIWANKCKQVFTKARFAMSDDPDSLAYMKQLAQETGFSLT